MSNRKNDDEFDDEFDEDDELDEKGIPAGFHLMDEEAELGYFLSILRQDEDDLTSLRSLLLDIVANDVNYPDRNVMVAKAMAVALELGMKAGYRIDPDDPEWPVAFIQLPTGQVSWHTPQFEKDWDGHSTTEKIERIAEYCRQ